MPDFTKTSLVLDAIAILFYAAPALILLVLQFL